jgi:Holliday junction resolvase RusA-like endonuclease
MSQPIAKFKLTGQIPSGKNSVVVTRKGHRFPAKRFKDWKADAIKQLHDQGIKPINIKTPVSCTIKYSAGNLRRRDVPGMIDALWHLIEYCAIVHDDKYLGDLGQRVIFDNLGLDRENPGVEVIIYEHQPD